MRKRDPIECNGTVVSSATRIPLVGVLKMRWGEREHGSGAAVDCT